MCVVLPTYSRSAKRTVQRTKESLGLLVVQNLAESAKSGTDSATRAREEPDVPGSTGGLRTVILLTTSCLRTGGSISTQWTGSCLMVLSLSHGGRRHLFDWTVFVMNLEKGGEVYS
jgi:hypothetical protein